VTGTVTTRAEHDGAILRVVLGPGPANIVDRASIEALRTVIRDLPADGPLRAIVV